MPASSYSIDGQLALGRTVELFEARRIGDDGVARRCVVACLRDDVELPPDARANFSRAADTIAVVDVGEMNGRPFVVLDLPEGPDIDKELGQLEAAVALLASGDFDEDIVTVVTRAAERRPGRFSELVNIELLLAGPPSAVSSYSTVRPISPPSVHTVEIVERDPMIDKAVGPCRIDGVIGEGSYGKVYRATHLGLGHLCAIKILRATNMPRAAHERFEREAAALSQIEHPNLVRLYEAGSYEDRPYLIMEYLHGRTLRDVVRSGLMPWQRALHISRQIAAGLAAAHAAGLVHRDLKPLNIMVVDEHGLDHVKILDFGLVRLLHSDAELTRLTRTDSLLGTPRWMAPEQIVNPHDIDPRADLFALGLLMHYMVCGPRAVSGPLHELAARRHEGPPAHVPEAGLLEEVLQQLQQPNPDQRIASATLVVERLDQIERLDDTAMAVGPTRLVQPVVQKRAAISIGFLALASVMVWGAFTIAYVTGEQRSPEPTPTEVAPQIAPAPRAARLDTPPPPPVEPERRIRPTRIVEPRAPKPPSGPTIRQTELRVQRSLTNRGLRLKDLRASAETTDAMRNYDATRTRADEREFDRAATALLDRAKRVSAAEVLRGRLGLLKKRMATAAAAGLDRETLVTLEGRYLDLRAVLKKDVTDAQAREVSTQIDALSRDLP